MQYDAESLGSRQYSGQKLQDPIEHSAHGKLPHGWTCSASTFRCSRYVRTSPKEASCGTSSCGISTPNSCSTTATSVTAVKESQISEDSALTFRISSGVSQGNTALKHRTKRLSCSNMSRVLNAVKQRWNTGVELLPAQKNRGAWRGTEQFREELLKRPVPGCGFVG